MVFPVNSVTAYINALACIYSHSFERILMTMQRRHFLSAGVATALAVSPRTWAAGAVLPPAQSLAEELSVALQRHQPLVVMVSLEGCPFCRVARDSYLSPLRLEGQVPVVQVDMRSSAVVRGFKREPLTHDSLARLWKIKVAPTVLFFGADGREVAERLEGGYIADFYGAYLEQRLERARATIAH
jgi:hypothetical protein